MTMLHHCAFMGNTDLCRSIIHVAPQTPPDMDAADSDGWTPLHYAADKGHTETVRLLLEEGASVNSKDAMRRTPLHLAALGGHVGVIQVLLEEGATKNAKNIAGMTAKECATTAGHEAASALL
ncbi:26S proteasome non-ATPase regulatory subunit 10 [Angomonas deanei]|nr:26S proteasome non-ATPase regulatory subunit 10 [Angomonas deanei]|eukprot:EPY40064.1 26S proteasome non-ATPase regulatory subunit 10 [Angomonas deanei]